MIETVIKSSPAFVAACGQAAPIVSSGVFLSPVPTVQNIMADQDVGKLPLLPYSSMVVSAFLWTSYGLLKKDSKVWAPNAFGLFCGINYFYQFQKNCSVKAKDLPGTVSQHIQGTTAFIALACLLAATLSVEVASNLIGKLGVFVCVVLFASPLVALKTVIQTKSAKSIPLPFTLTCILNCFLWTVYGIDVRDFNIFFPNFLGLLASLAQFGVILFYGKGKPQQLPI